MVAFEEVTKPRGGTVEERGENPNKSFRVFIRLCPEEQRDPPSDEARGFIKVKRPNQVVVDTGRGHPSQTLEFNAVWDETATQKEVYESAAKPLVESLLQGHNGCVITYSSPASGRSSHSLLGDGGIAGAQRGIVSRAAEDIFSSPEALNCKIRVSFIQVSNEKIYDLLESQSAEVCRIREGGGAVLLEGLTEVEVGSPQGVLQLYRRGAGNRQSGASRGEFAGKSHIIFNITIAMQMPKATSGQEGLLTTCKLTLVDLTSSAKVPARCGPVPDVRRGLQATPENAQEVKMLKRSLTIFGNVIFALSTAGREHVPYRESKLTRILRDCLGGDCRTSLIVTVSPNPTCVSEALSSLQFARRAMAVPKRQRRCSPLQVRGTKAAEKPKSGHCRRATQRAALTGKRVHPQTCLPPIQHMLVPPSGNGWKRCDEPDHKVVLPQLDVGGTQAMRSAKAARPGEERGGVASLSRRPSEEKGGEASLSRRPGEGKGGGASLSRRPGEGKGGGASLSRRPGEEKGGGASLSRQPGEEKGGGASLSRQPGEEKGGGASLSRQPGEEKGGGASLSRQPGEEKGGGASLSRQPGEEKGGGASLSRQPGEEKGGGASLSRQPGEEKGGGASLSRQPGEEKGGGASLSRQPGEEKGGGASLSRQPGEEKGGGASLSRQPGEEKGGGASLSRQPGEEKGGGASLSRQPGEEKGGGASLSRQPGEEKGGGASLSTAPRSLSLSSMVVGIQAAEPSDWERKARPEALHSPRVSSDCLPPPPAPSATAATPPLSTDCPSCNRERKIRQEYDRYIVQARRDRDALSQRVQELEARLQRREKAEPPCSSGSPGAWGAAGTQTGEAANISEQGLFSSGGFALSLRYDIASQGGALQGADCPAGSKGSGGQAEEDRENERLPILQGEPEALQDQWGEYSGREEELARQLQEETDPAVLEAQDLRALLEKDQLQLHSLERQKENLSLELEDVRVKYAIFQEEAALVMADLQREKDDLLSQIEERGKSYEKVAMENMDLKVKMDALLGKVGPGGPPDPRSPHRLTTSTELVVLSHHVSHCYSKTQYPDYCIQSAAGIADENTVTSDSDGNPLATKEIFRQLRREHSLLRDVMLILYRRRWFVDDAVPYVRRTLRKCGAKLGPPD
ncbi:uncharacterized protein si:ch211-63b16.4 [Brienomyrus brachyistius]|uniref:uncharacterized protein si:ch211-63b16.4 n=1 Tax=Brienomyrus brachyistius TaxID=42636 RepID=UPI0020B2E867|nr:uncharacterized protein si:ch211-63b16.4 [Brienomyrus brachyistius]XP_048865391.1 uncharacterized protein si:ch211-63b16.4 [Brienomyrus brachyistius]XP_048865393.1 uncharacterized protein si:ch211-63b16.4 [Brienomyrus brachyistius]XP_048865394.1 uncharacterized protein si:ch211-63b16.4 [Brienomyrus brachyistius]